MDIDDTISSQLPPDRVATILIADDDRELVAAMSRRLMHMGHRVTVARDALSALVLVKRDRPDLVLLDIHMPAGNGMCVLEMIRSEPEWAELPVVVLSGAADDSMIARVCADGAHFVPKTAGMWPKVQAHVNQSLLSEQN